MRVHLLQETQIIILSKHFSNFVSRNLIVKIRNKFFYLTVKHNILVYEIEAKGVWEQDPKTHVWTGEIIMVIEECSTICNSMF